MKIKSLDSFVIVIIGFFIFESLAWAASTCPRHRRPRCKAAETIVSVTHKESGCLIPVCKVCPKYEVPECKDNFVLTTTYDAEACPKQECKEQDGSGN